MPENHPVLDDAVVRFLNAFAEAIRESVKESNKKQPRKRCKYVASTTCCDCKDCHCYLHNCAPCMWSKEDCPYYEPVDIESQEEDKSGLRLYV